MSITRTLTVAAAAVAALSLAACASDTTSGSESPTGATATSQERSQAPATTTVEPAAAAPETTAPEIDYDKIAEMAYMSTVEEYTYPSREEALQVGYAACALLSTGSTPEDLAYEVLTARGTIAPGFRNDELPYFYGAAMGSLCQEHGWQLGLDFG